MSAARGFGILLISLGGAWALWQLEQRRASEEAAAREAASTPRRTGGGLGGIGGLLGVLGALIGDSTPGAGSAGASGGAGSGIDAVLGDIGAMGGGVAGLRALIRRAEAGSAGYNAFYHGSRIKPPAPVTTMTVAAVQKWQAESVAAGSASSAVGGYQFIRKTLAGLGPPPGAKFSAGLQDQLADKLLERRGLSSYRRGAISAQAFANNLAMEWAGLPVVTGAGAGRSYYAGDGLNASTVTPAQVLAAIRGI